MQHGRFADGVIVQARENNHWNCKSDRQYLVECGDTTTARQKEIEEDCTYSLMLQPLEAAGKCFRPFDFRMRSTEGNQALFKGTGMSRIVIDEKYFSIVTTHCGCPRARKVEQDVRGVLSVIIHICNCAVLVHGRWN